MGGSLDGRRDRPSVFSTWWEIFVPLIVLTLKPKSVSVTQCVTGCHAGLRKTEGTPMLSRDFRDGKTILLNLKSLSTKFLLLAV
jgi:hypothetical protein